MARDLKKEAIIDCDIHHQINDFKELFPYLPRNYQQQIELWGTQLPSFPLMNGGKEGRRVDAFPPEGGHAGTSLSFMQEQYLDPHHVQYGVLTGEFVWNTTTPDVEYAAALCSALNDWTIENWLEKDSRLKGSILIPTQDPNLAKKEIERVGSHPSMVQVYVPAGARMPYGQRFYYPIYEACEELGLPFTMHVGMEGVGINGAPTGVGYPTYYIEYRALRAQTYMAHLASFIFEGVFERFPSLRFVMLEAGVFWYPPFLARLDEDWKALRHQTPWVKRLPSEYFRDHVSVGTQPIEPVPDLKMFHALIDWMHGKDTLLYCSDYPHWDFDSPDSTFPKMDEELRRRIFYENAKKLYKW